MRTHCLTSSLRKAELEHISICRDRGYTWDIRRDSAGVERAGWWNGDVYLGATAVHAVSFANSSNLVAV